MTASLQKQFLQSLESLCTERVYPRHLKQSKRKQKDTNLISSGQEVIEILRQGFPKLLWLLLTSTDSSCNSKTLCSLYRIHIQVFGNPEYRFTHIDFNCKL